MCISNLNNLVSVAHVCKVEKNLDQSQLVMKTGVYISQMSHCIRKSTKCLGENKGGNRDADQRICFHYMDSTIPLLLKYKI